MQDLQVTLKNLFETSKNELYNFVYWNFLADLDSFINTNWQYKEYKVGFGRLDERTGGVYIDRIYVRQDINLEGTKLKLSIEFSDELKEPELSLAVWVPDVVIYSDIITDTESFYQMANHDIEELLNYIKTYNIFFLYTGTDLINWYCYRRAEEYRLSCHNLYSPDNNQYIWTLSNNPFDDILRFKSKTKLDQELINTIKKLLENSQNREYELLEYLDQFVEEKL